MTKNEKVLFYQALTDLIRINTKDWDTVTLGQAKFKLEIIYGLVEAEYKSREEGSASKRRVSDERGPRRLRCLI